MADDRPPQIGWLHYRLAVAFCAAMVMGLTLLVVPLLLAIAGSGAEPLVLYSLVFSRWGAAAVLGAFALGFALGGERTANFFAFIWGTHPVWSEVGAWLEEHDSAAAVLGFAAVALVISFVWYGFR